jgi:hypothetical protein
MKHPLCDNPNCENGMVGDSRSTQRRCSVCETLTKAHRQSIADTLSKSDTRYIGKQPTKARRKAVAKLVQEGNVEWDQTAEHISHFGMSDDEVDAWYDNPDFDSLELTADSKGFDLAWAKNGVGFGHKGRDPASHESRV